MIGYTLNSVIRADGAPAFAMIATVAGAVTNIILDPIFIFVLDWGISGAAWATITGQILTLVISIVYLTRTKTFKLHLASLKPQKEVLSSIAKLGISTLITQLSIVIISMVCNKMLAIYGADSVYGANDPLAIIGICMKVFTIVLSIAMGIIIGAQPILGYNVGAGLNDRVRELSVNVSLPQLSSVSSLRLSLKSGQKLLLISSAPIPRIPSSICNSLHSLFGFSSCSSPSPV